MGFIDRPQTLWFRRALFQIHLWTGVAIGLYVIAISLSGSALVFQQDVLDDTQHASAVPNLRLSFGEAASVAQRAHPKQDLLYIDNRDRNPNVVSLLFRDTSGTRVVNVDRASGEIVDDSVRQKRHPVFSFLEALHNELLSGPTGERVNGVGGGLLFMMSATGVILWWPGRSNWRRAMTVLWNARWQRVNFDLHLAFGFWTLLLVALWAVTGLYFAFPFPLRKAVAFFTPVIDMPRASHWKPGDPVLPIDVFVARAAATFPSRDVAFITYGVQEQNGAIVVLLSTSRRFPLEIARDLVYLHPASAEILGIESSMNWTWGDKLLMWAYTVHFGDFGGLPVKLLWMSLGIAPAGLTVTGYLMWWNRALKKKWTRLRKAF